MGERRPARAITKRAITPPQVMAAFLSRSDDGALRAAGRWRPWLYSWIEDTVGGLVARYTQNGCAWNSACIGIDHGRHETVASLFSIALTSAMAMLPTSTA
jgi:hypothetical protein